MAQILVLKPGNFFGLANDLLDVHGKTIGPLGILVYVGLARYANRTTGQCWPSIDLIARTVRLARSTVKIYLRKLEAAGLISITERRNAAGDCTSHLYTLLDPTPAVVEARTRDRETCTAQEGGRSTVDLPLEDGGVTDGPPQVGSQPTGRPTDNPKPSSLEPKEENQQEKRLGAEEPQKPPTGNLCSHPLPEISRFGEIAVCRHCWTMLDTDIFVTKTPALDTQEEQDATLSRAA